MPFIDAAGGEIDTVPLRYRGGRLFQLTEPLIWLDPRDGSRRIAPAHDPLRSPDEPGNSTDLASVPPFLWGLVASYGRQTLPAILHDALEDAAALAPPAARLERRRRADDDFRVALVEQGVPELRATTMWAAVRVEGYLRHATGRGVLLVLQLLLGALACVAAVALGVAVQPAWLALLLVPAALAPLWGARAPLALTAGYLSALYLPLLVGAGALSLAEYAVAAIAWALRGGRGAAPRPGPLLRR